MVPIGGVDHGLGDVVAGLHLGVREGPAELIPGEPHGYRALPFPVCRGDLGEDVASAVLELPGHEPYVLDGLGEGLRDPHVAVEVLKAVVGVPEVGVEREAAFDELVVVPRLPVGLSRIPPVRDVPAPHEEEPPFRLHEVVCQGVPLVPRHRGHPQPVDGLGELLHDVEAVGDDLGVGEPYPRQVRVFVVHVGDEDLDPPPLAFPDAAEVFVQVGLLPRAYDVDGFRGLEVDEVAAVFGVGRAELELVDEQDPRQRPPPHLRVGLVEHVDGLGLGHPVGPGGPFEGVPLVQLREDGGPLQVRQRPPGHRAFQGDGEGLAASLAHVFDPVADQDLGLQQVRPEPDLGDVPVLDDAGSRRASGASRVLPRLPPSYTKPSSDWMGPSVRSKSSGFIPKESKNALESIWSPFVVFCDQRKDSKGGLFL